MFSGQVNISGCWHGHYQGNHYWMIHWLYQDVSSPYCAPRTVLCEGGARLNKTHFLSSREVSALTGHHLHCLERWWWNWKDLLGVTRRDGGAVRISVAGVLRLTDVGHAAPHSRDKVAVVFRTLAVSLQSMGREERVLVSHLGWHAS